MPQAKYSSQPDLVRDILPPINRSMKELDRDFFHRDVPLVAARVGDPTFITKIGKEARNDLLQLQGVSRIVRLGTTENEKGILLRHDIQNPETVINSVSERTAELFQQGKCTFEKYTLPLTYDYWKTEEILAAILPEDLLEEIPSGFTNVGHIAHMNIRDNYLPYRFLIGQVVLDKNKPLIRTVVNKLDAIDTVYRTFAMEVLAGERDFIVEQSESGCRFRFDFSKVYWNSRLHTEHDRLIKTFSKGDAVCDVFAGVGPFAVPAGRKGVIVLANDLNPDSYECLVGNIGLNKTRDFVVPYNMDGQEFIKKSAQMLPELQHENDGSLDLLPRRYSKNKPIPSEKIPIPSVFQHYVMNLPDSAISFLDGFIGIYSSSELRQKIFGSDATPTEEHLPWIHVHCFHKNDPLEPEPTEEEIYEDLRRRVSEAMQFEIALEKLHFHKVRKVAPTKIMYCISYKLPVEVALKQA